MEAEKTQRGQQHRSKTLKLEDPEKGRTQRDGTTAEPGRKEAFIPDGFSP